MNDILLFFVYKYEGDSKKILSAIERKEQVDLIELQEIKETIKDKYITLLDKNYPKEFMNVIDPPFIIFYRGDISLLNKKSLAFIGSRHNSEYGEMMVEKLVKPLAKKYVIVSGLAKGIDSLAHKCCLENDGSTIAILGHGLDYCYPSINEDLKIEIENKGLIISEYPSFMKPRKENFPKRNRLIAALSKGVVVVESKRKSGTMITVEHALNLGKDIFCVPDQAINDSGCNYLIKMGANLVENANDIMDLL